jgi:hypothetical protein
MVLMPNPEPKGSAQQRERVRFARDVGDEVGLAWAHEPRRRRSKFTVGTAIALGAFVVLGALPVLFNEGDGQLVKADCARPAVGTGPTRIEAGRDFAWQAAGPEAGPYVVALDAAEVTGPAQGPVTTAGQVLAGPTALTGCRSAQTVAGGPLTRGSHEIALFRLTASGWERVAVARLQVS